MDYREIYLNGVAELEKWYIFNGRSDEILKIIPLVRNGKFLLLGPYGYGKSLYAYLVAKIFFGYDIDSVPVVQLMDDLSIYDVFFNMDVPSLMKGNEKIVPRAVVTEPFKFINEFQRGNYKIYNALLGLFSEGFITFRDKIFKTEDYVAILDANPFDAGSVEVPRALMNRITGSFNMRSMGPENLLKLMDAEVDVNNARKILDAHIMNRIWDEVETIKVNRSMYLLLTLLHGYFSNCIYGDRAMMDPRHVSNLCSSCVYRTEPCSMIKEPLGHRWWRDAIAIARARAYYYGREHVNVDDIFFGSLYSLNHRVYLRERARVIYPSSEAWIRESLENARVKLKKIWIPALKGNDKARKEDQRTLKGMEVEV